MSVLAPSRHDEVAPHSGTAARSTVWVLEAVLVERRTHLQVGQEIHAPIAPLTYEAEAGALRGFPLPGRVAWQLYPSAAEAALEVPRPLHGQVEQIMAITAPHRQMTPGHWLPVPGRVRTRAVESTCAPDPARSVWIPSGNPVLLGFLITISSRRESTSGC